MKLKDIVAITGVAGLNKMLTNRNNGLVAEHLDTGKTKFYPIRKHQFTPLETVAVYTYAGTAELKEIFETMRQKMHELPLPSSSAPAPELMEYFENILPDYDKDRVFSADVKKLLKWFVILDSKGYLLDNYESAQEVDQSENDNNT
ncbi:MAG TPA: DUF5606 domain-containing protein [Saprospiraceae bacterium]|mgnify:CR=1 FL=1|nr:DUF5606 domain-containing protein [Saprospiraceae bacterium]